MSRFPLVSSHKDLVGVTIEKALTDVSKQIRSEVESRLKDDYDCTFSDCIDHPEYLNKILKEFYGHSYESIVDSIKQKLVDFEENESIKNFVVGFK